MGCHTWSYVKFKPSDEVIEKMKNDFIEKYHHYMNDTPKEIFDDNERYLKERFPDYVPESYSSIDQGEFEEEVEYWRGILIKYNVLEQIKSGDFTNFEILLDEGDYLNPPGNDSMILFYNNEWYAQDDSIASDMFRVGNYPEEKFTDAESLIAWLKTLEYVGYYPCSNDNVGMCEELEEKIRDAFAEHPGLLIEFG